MLATAHSLQKHARPSLLREHSACSCINDAQVQATCASLEADLEKQRAECDRQREKCEAAEAAAGEAGQRADGLHSALLGVQEQGGRLVSLFVCL